MESTWTQKEADSRSKLKSTVVDRLGDEETAEQVLKAAFDAYPLPGVLSGEGEGLTVDACKLIEYVMELRLLLTAALMESEYHRRLNKADM